MVWVGRHLTDHPVPPPLPWAGTPSPSPGCSQPFPTWPWALPGRGQPQAASGQPGPGPRHRQSKAFLPYAQSKPALLKSLLPLIWSLPALVTSPSPALSQPLQALAAALRSPRSLLFPRLSSPSSPSLSSHQRSSSPRIIAGASSGPTPTAPGLSCAEGSRAGCRTPGGEFTFLEPTLHTHVAFSYTNVTRNREWQWWPLAVFPSKRPRT